MKTFKQHITEQKNTHMQHIEDSVLYGGVAGVRQAILSMRGLRDILAGNSSSEHDVTVKWDGAPAIFAGIDPTDGKFFVAKKGIFNKDSKVYKTNADIDEDTSGDLNAKLKVALAELPKLGIKGIVQGDFLFGPGDIKREKIDGDSYIVFHPNTIAYAVLADSNEAKAMEAAKIGIVWHTSYSGSTFKDMKANYGVDSSTFRNVKSVYSFDAGLRDLSGKVTLTKSDYNEVTKALSDAGKAFNKVKSSALKDLENNKTIAQTIEQFNNSKVRVGAEIGDVNKHTKDLVKFIENKYQKEIDKLKTEKGKAGKAQKRDEFLKFFINNDVELKAVFELQKSLVKAKLVLLAKLNNIQNTSAFVKTKDGFKVTGHEGLVAIDKTTSGAYKLVDRMEFSKNNFSADIIKGWQSDRRG